MNPIARSTSSYLFSSILILITFDNLNAIQKINIMNIMHPMPSWISPMVEEVAQKFNIKTPTIYQRMRSNRQFNPRIIPTCTGIRLEWGNLVIGDRLIAKLDKEELKLLTMRAFVSSKNWYATKKILLILTLLFSTASILENSKHTPTQALLALLFDAIAYIGFNIYTEKYIDREIIKDSRDQEVLDNAYQKISPARWPSFCKNVDRYLGI